MSFPILKLKVLPEEYALYRLHPNSRIPKHLQLERFVSTTRSDKELTIVCEEGKITEYDKKERNWKCLKIDSSFDLDAVGVIAAIATPLAEIRVSIYVVSTFDTDYILVKEDKLAASIECLSNQGHQIGFSG